MQHPLVSVIQGNEAQTDNSPSEMQLVVSSQDLAVVRKVIVRSPPPELLPSSTPP